MVSPCKATWTRWRYSHLCRSCAAGWKTSFGGPAGGPRRAGNVGEDGPAGFGEWRAVTERLGRGPTEALGVFRVSLAGLTRFAVATRLLMPAIVLLGGLVGGLDVAPIGEILGGRGLPAPFLADGPGGALPALLDLGGLERPRPATNSLVKSSRENLDARRS